MIIVEGPDGAGKSTLVKQLHDDLDFPIAERAVDPQTNALTDLKVWTEENVAMGFQPKIFDRHRLISDPIYRFILPHKKMDPYLYDYRWLSQQFSKFHRAKPIIIFCLPPLEVVMHNIEHGEDDNSAVKDYIEQIYYAYVAKAADCWTRSEGAYRWDYTSDDPDGRYRLLLDLIRYDPQVRHQFNLGEQK